VASRLIFLSDATFCVLRIDRLSAKTTAGQFANLQDVTSGSAGTPRVCFGVPARGLSHPACHAEINTYRTPLLENGKNCDSRLT